MRQGMTAALEKRLRRADPTAYQFVEALVTHAEDVATRKDQWQDADSVSGLTLHDNGDVEIDGSSTATLILESGTEDGDVTTLDRDDGFFFVTQWAGTDPYDTEISEIIATLDPDEAGTGKEVDAWRLQLFGVASVNSADRDLFDGVTLVPLSQVVHVTAGGVKIGVTFPISGIGSAGRARPMALGAPRGLSDTNDRGWAHAPVTFVKIWAVDVNGDPVGSVGWPRDSTVTDYTYGSKISNGELWTQNPDGTWKYSSTVGLPSIRISTPSIATSATITFSTNDFDLGASPVGDVELAVAARLPDGTSITPEFRVPAGTWTAFVDGDRVGEDNTSRGGTDLTAIAKQQTYEMRVTLNANTAQTLTPALVELGIRDVTISSLDGLVTVSGSRAAVDPVTLKGEISAVTLSIVRDGYRDFRDRITEILEENDVDDIQFRLWWGAADLARSAWLHWDTFKLTNYDPLAAHIVCEGEGALRVLRGTIPRAVDNGGTVEREPYIQAPATLKVAYDAILSDFAIPERFKGPGVEVTDGTKLVSKTIRPQERSDGKAELDALARLARGGLISSQGRVKFVDMFTESAPQAIFDDAEIHMLTSTPGLAERLPEFFVPFEWNKETRDYTLELRRFHAKSITAFDYGSTSTRQELDDIVAQWITETTLAQQVGQDVVDTMGTGLILWVFRSAHPYPELEPGDRVIVNTRQFVARDPNLAAALKGSLWASAVITQAAVDGHEFAVWIQSYADIRSTFETVVRLRGDAPDATAITAPDVTVTAKQYGYIVDIAVDCSDVGGVGARTVWLYTSAESGFTPGAGTLRAKLDLAPGGTSVVFTGLDPNALGGWLRTIYARIEVSDELTSQLGETLSQTSELTLGSFHVVNVGDQGGTKKSGATVNGLWKFEEASGDDIGDLTGGDEISRIAGSGSWIDGPAGGAYDSGADASLRSDEAARHDIGGSTDFTIDLILRCNAFTTDGQIVFHDQDYYLRIGTNAELEYSVRDHWGAQSTGIFLDEAGFDLLDEWVSIKWQYDQATSVSTFWLNGQLVGTHTATGSAAGSAIADSLFVLCSASGTNRLDAALSYLRIVAGAHVSDFPYLRDIDPRTSKRVRQIKVPVSAYQRVFPGTDTMVSDADGAEIRANDANLLRIIATVDVHPGDIVVGWDAWIFTTSSGTDNVDIELRRTDVSSMPGTRTTVDTLIDNAGGWHQREDLALNQLVVKDEEWVIYGVIDPDSSASSARIGTVNVYVRPRP